MTKSKHENDKRSIEDKLKRYYSEEIGRLEEEIGSLRRQLAFKEEDLRNKDENIHKLEVKLDTVLQSREALKNMEDKVIHLGQENNVVKNLAEVVKKGKKT